MIIQVGSMFSFEGNLLMLMVEIRTGGKKILQRVAGKDASKQFWKYHNEGILKKYQAQLQIGSLDSKPKAETPAPAPPAPKKEAAPKKATSATSSEESEALDPFGQLIPFADPAWYQGVSREPLMCVLGCD
jgi:hypothetical protein